jgi:hypothetical protein
LVDQFCCGGDLLGEATRESPVRTEPHPTSAGTFHVILPYDEIPRELSRIDSTNFVMKVTPETRQRGGAFRVILPYDAIPRELSGVDWYDWSINFVAGMTS